MDQHPESPPYAPGTRSQAVGFLLFDGFGMLAFASALDALRQANRLAAKELYRWTMFGVSGDAVRSSAGVPIAVQPLATGATPDLLLVIAGSAREGTVERAAYPLLRRLARGRCRLAGVSLGSYLLARARLLDGHRCTVHWENLDAFREQFPHLEVTSEVFEIDRDRLTCSGGTGALDLLLHHIASMHGAALAKAIADIYIHARIRGSDEPQRMPLRTRLGVSHPKLLAAIDLIEAGDESVQRQAALARRVGLSGRHLERLFRKHLRTTPRAYHLAHRLRRARSLLRETSLDVLEVALACGFSTGSHFTKTYREHFGVTPSVDRHAGVR